MIHSNDDPIGQILSKIADFLDITETQHRVAVERYRAVADWLAHENSPLRKYSPELYPQGSFRLGTVIRPISGSDEFDIDLVCLLNVVKESTSQYELKRLVGDRLKQNKTYSHMLEEKRRCWTLTYSDGARFHLDILPAIPDPEGGQGWILLTDRKLVNWQRSNPRGYAKWFEGCMTTAQLEFRRRILAANPKYEFPQDWEVRTPLQRSIQLLKRHRDLRFEGRADLRPTSIMITTVAAQSYDNGLDLFGAFQRILSRLHRPLIKINGSYQLLNPANPRENFADKWNEDEAKADAYEKWVEAIRLDFKRVATAAGIDDKGVILKSAFGDSVVEKAAHEIAANFKGSRENGSLRLTSTGSLGVTGVKVVRNHTFYGSED